MVARWRRWARAIKRDVVALHLAARDPRVPWRAKLVAACVAAYALSPVDLIPDVVPVLGYLDDLVIVPLGILLAARLVPPELMTELRAEADRRGGRRTSRSGLVAIVGLWIALAILAAWRLAGLVSRWRAVPARERPAPAGQATLAAVVPKRSVTRSPGPFSPKERPIPCSRAIAATLASPSPLPGVERLASSRTKRFKARSRNAPGMP